MTDTTAFLRTTPLDALHRKLGARMVPFAGYEMPVQFEGVKAEHLWTREKAGLFDVSHMGPSFLSLRDGMGEDGAHGRVSALLEQLVPGDIAGLEPGQGRLTVLTGEQGGILDDLIVTRMPDPDLQGMLYLVVNGAMKQQDWALIEDALGSELQLERADDRILAALQGPLAEDVVADLFPEARELRFMRSAHIQRDGERFMLSRSGYTGEDGFEMLLPGNAAGVALFERLLDDERVKPVGLAARDSLRLEAGLCLYGQDMDADTTPVEAGLSWLVSKRRRTEGGYPGADRIGAQLEGGTDKARVGFRPEGRAPARAGTPVEADGRVIGVVTSGGFGPSVDAPVAMGYVESGFKKPGTPVDLMIRGKRHRATVAKLPFVPPRQKR